ncbi:MAG: replicative DNA helicase [Myxococcota bacterium]
MPRKTSTKSATTTTTSIADRLPPHNIETERLVLGAILFDNDSIDKIIEFLSPEDFYRSAHQDIFEAMIAIHTKEEAIDAVTLSQYLDSMGKLQSIGGADYLVDLLGDTSSAANVVFHARIVSRLSTLRKLISISSDIARRAYEVPVDVEEFLDEAEGRIFELSRKKTDLPYAKLSNILTEGIQRLGQQWEQKGSATGLMSGYVDLDYYTSGFRPGQLIILGARPGMGKTSFALNAAVNICNKFDVPILFFSLEMTKEEVGMRILSSESGVSSHRIREPKELTDNDWEQITNAYRNRLTNLPLFVDDTSALQVLELRSKARRFKAENNGLGLIIVDYLQLMRGIPGRFENRNQEITDISRSLKALAKELSCPVMALSQLSRESERRKGDHRPVLADLRESGSIEQDADMVLFLYREEYYTKEKEDAKEREEKMESGVALAPPPTELIIAKHRNGPAGISVKLSFIESITRFENYTDLQPV